MARYRSSNGVVVNVRDDKPMSARWTPLGDSTGSPSGAGGTEPDTRLVDYGDWTVAELKAEIGRRNDERTDGDRLSPYQNKAGLIETLEADDNN